MSAISGPIAPYSNVPIESQFYQSSRFVISDIDLGVTTIVTATEDMNYVVGQLVRFLIPVPYGTNQLSGLQGYVISLPDTDQVEIDIDSRFFNEYVPSPFVYTITGASKATHCILTVSNSFTGGNSVTIADVSGMTELNGNTYSVLAANATTITLNVNSTTFTTYISGGTATIYPTDGRVSQILSIGDVNSGQINSNGLRSQSTFVPGAFINISPL